MGKPKSLKELSAEMVAKGADYDPVQVDGIVGLNNDVKGLVKLAIAKKLTKEPDVAKMKGVVLKMTEVIDKRQDSWDQRYEDLKSLSVELKKRLITAEDKKFLEELKKKCVSSKAKYDTLYNAVAELSKSLNSAQAVKDLASMNKGINAGVLVSKVNNLRAKISELNHLLMAIG